MDRVYFRVAMRMRIGERTRSLAPARVTKTQIPDSANIKKFCAKKFPGKSNEFIPPPPLWLHEIGQPTTTHTTSGQLVANSFSFPPTKHPYRNKRKDQRQEQNQRAKTKAKTLQRTPNSLSKHCIIVNSCTVSQSTTGLILVRFSVYKIEEYLPIKLLTSLFNIYTKNLTVISKALEVYQGKPWKTVKRVTKAQKTPENTAKSD